MEHCYNDRKYIRGAYEMLIFGGVFFTGTLVASIWDWRNSFPYWIACGLLFLSAGGLLYLSILNFLITMRKYAFSPEGIQIQDPLGEPVFYAWEQISDVGICNVHYAKKGSLRYEVVLRLVIGPELRGPKQGPGSWATWTYELRHRKTVITMLYDPQRLEELKKYRPQGVADYRNIYFTGSNYP